VSIFHEKSSVQALSWYADPTKICERAHRSTGMSPQPLHTKFERQIWMIQLCSTVLLPPPDLVDETGVSTLSATLRFCMLNQIGSTGAVLSPLRYPHCSPNSSTLITNSYFVSAMALNVIVGYSIHSQVQHDHRQIVTLRRFTG